jgi:N-acetylglutamate synthase-like GNAT family acetyltransferase
MRADALVISRRHVAPMYRTDTSKRYVLSRHVARGLKLLVTGTPPGRVRGARSRRPMYPPRTLLAARAGRAASADVVRDQLSNAADLYRRISAVSHWHICGTSWQVWKWVVLPSSLLQDRPVPIEIRDYRPADEQAWLRCRVLSFLGTAYFDAVEIAKQSPAIGAELVAAEGAAVVGILDFSVDASLATIDTIAVHPDHQHQGIGTKLFELARIRAAALGATTIDAWTRDDEATLHWYRARGFAESDHYLHVYADYDANADEPAEAVEPRPGLSPIKIFLHAKLERETEMRKKFQRVHVCRRFAQPIALQS